jgi:hypothetical protein
MRAFDDEAKLDGGKVRVSGPFDAEGKKVIRLRWVIAQGDVMVEGQEHHAGPHTWDGETEAQGLQPGPAHGFALAVMKVPGSPPEFEKEAWDQPVTITK